MAKLKDGWEKDLLTLTTASASVLPSSYITTASIFDITGILNLAPYPTNCPNCGAPMVNGECEYCGTGRRR